MDVFSSLARAAWRQRWVWTLLALSSVTLIGTSRAEEAARPELSSRDDGSLDLLALAPSQPDIGATDDSIAEDAADDSTGSGAIDDDPIDGSHHDGGDAPDVADDGTSSLETPRPMEWAPSYGRQCHRHKGRRVCEGPRRTPLPHGEAQELAKRLGLGTRQAASALQLEPPPTEWLDVLAVASDDEDGLHWPVDDGQLWRRFGFVRNRRGRRRLHRGIDVGAPAGALIRSVARGLVVYSDNTIGGYGNLMLILHADGTVAWYAHCRANYVFAGQTVRRGQVIGEVGATGLAQGAHLHFELRRDGRAFDPLPLFEDPPIARHARR